MKKVIFPIIVLFLFSCNSSFLDKNLLNMSPKQLLDYSEEFYELDRDSIYRVNDSINTPKYLRQEIILDGLFFPENIVWGNIQKQSFTQRILERSKELSKKKSIGSIKTNYLIFKNRIPNNFYPSYIQLVERDLKRKEKNTLDSINSIKEKERLQKKQELGSRLLDNFPGTYINYPMGEQNYHITNKITIYSSGSLIFESTFGSGGYESGNWRFTNDTNFELMMTSMRVRGRIESNGDLYVNGLGNFEKFR